MEGDSSETAPNYVDIDICGDDNNGSFLKDIRSKLRDFGIECDIVFHSKSRRHSVRIYSDAFIERARDKPW